MKRTDVLGVEGRMRRGRPRLRGLHEERFSGSGRMRARDRGEWKRLVEMVVKRD